ncbi:hypothetical protein CAPI_01515 [Corynebacterium capitovis DSM 44611]|uniref:L,D-transpeptidase n=1 Tax=Corynebacterium capitovis TaxID=131081 RepID=UPI00035FCC35|nr:L,D-transpeptidase [Corynebacterium capitovis]WKD56877.1 hypothetical protein CAPI_01515 [Corynebacterium capitovis DSM 44611]
MSYTPRHAKPSLSKRRLGVVAGAAALTTTLFGGPDAHAQDAGLDGFIAQVNATFQDAAQRHDASAREGAWGLRAAMYQQADGLATVNPALPAQAKAAVDQAVEAAFPGLIAQRTAPEPAAQAAPAAEAAPAEQAAPAFDYGPCPRDAKACIDIDGRRSWLQNDGQVYHQAAAIGPGRAGYETPRGTFYVNRKVKDEISYEFNNAPMPYATYFTNNGIAFHEGDPSILSHGCIRMYRADAQRYFDDLQVGDKVFVY